MWPLALLAGELDFAGIDDNDKIAGIEIRGVMNLMFAAQEDGGMA
jgi:hypothetical protein